MNNLASLLMIVLAFSGCASTQQFREGAKAGSQAIAVARVTVLPANSAAPLITVEQRPLIGPVGSFEPEPGEPLVIFTLVPGTYNWVDMLTVQYGKVNLRGVLPAFTVGRGCISYIGDINLNFSGARPVVSVEKRKEPTLSEFKRRYPRMFESNPVCQ